MGAATTRQIAVRGGADAPLLDRNDPGPLDHGGTTITAHALSRAPAYAQREERQCQLLEIALGLRDPDDYWLGPARP